MGNTHIEPETKENLLAYMEENSNKSVSRGVDALLADHRELLVTRRENVLLTQLVRILDTWDKS